MPSEKSLKQEIERLKSAVAELSLLNELALAVSSANDVDLVLETIIKKSLKAVRAEQGSIMLVTPQAERPFKTLIRREEQSDMHTTYKVGANITGWVLKHKQPLLVQDLKKDTRFKLRKDERGDIQSLLCVPVTARGKIIGVLTVTNKKGSESFSQTDLRLMTIIAAQSGQLIHNSQLQLESIEKKRLEHQLDLAREIQLRLLPAQNPAHLIYDIASYFEAADQVGGDYFDYFRTKTGQQVVVVADVSGHGAPAALVMTLLKGILHASLYDFQSPEKVLSEINDILSTMMPPDMFITMQILVLDPIRKRLHFANAGHVPFIHLSAKNYKCNLIELTSCGLNLLPGYNYNSDVIGMDPGDVLVIYTDGITEVFNDQSEMYGAARLCRAIEKCSGLCAAEIIDYLKDDLLSFRSGAGQEDDQVLIVIKIR
jgi:phosphoserine phosphatase RsbU/P